MREYGPVGKIIRAMDHVQTVNTRDSDLLHRFFLDLADHGCRLLPGMGPSVHHVQDGSNFIYPEYFVQLGRIKGLMGVVFKDGNGELDHLSGFFLQGHPFQGLFHPGLKVGILVRRDRCLVRRA